MASTMEGSWGAGSSGVQLKRAIHRTSDEQGQLSVQRTILSKVLIGEYCAELQGCDR